ncbi:hypothetical protein F5Y00DRAFT_270187 [Daldinia vernicosa]|uniref:uncharacterized protein n=1 Tax=Daldinia vernicosa TaxID=114800 RepID=UPI002007C464|nr:uncharacterized protein F5Y00DRAFT_270187 [Daldinia vernicosa]KAI0848453.1 hypothetical protein F5Y00DRAFT_270187 [Daldinia vernicosa]
MDDIAIVGYSFKFPQDAKEQSSFWEVLQNRKNLMTEWPKERLNVDSFYGERSNTSSTMNCRGAHFIDEDPSVFDAPFFSITAKEAAAMDPQQRWALETSYRAFENAGIPAENLKGSNTAVFGASFWSDYLGLYSKDIDNLPSMGVTGIASSMIPNRLSWYFDLRGPSVHIDTACSSSMVAVDLACQAISNGSATAALVVGTNLLLGPECSILLSNMHFLSPESLCYSFDARANGYARGEGIAAIVLKPVAGAVRDGDMIRAVIRSIGSNQDGKTPSLTQPSLQAQESLIRSVYEKKGLSLGATRYFEAHGTGTPVGDPIEMKAIGQAFRDYRSNEEPLYVGSVKSNIGHLEGCSALAGIIKAIAMLEKGVIPPNALFENANPNIDLQWLKCVVPTQSIPWPSQGLRRISVNSFGIGGTNSHLVMDDAFHYITERGLNANHATIPSRTRFVGNPPTFTEYPTSSVHSSVASDMARRFSPMNFEKTLGSSDEAEVVSVSSEASSIALTPLSSQNPSYLRLLIWTAADEGALERVVLGYNHFCQSFSLAHEDNLDRLAYTLAKRRNLMPWRSYAVVDSSKMTTKLRTSKATRAPLSPSGLAVVFTGQGAQYANMGVDLMQFDCFRDMLRSIDRIYQSLGSQWSLFRVIADEDKINQPTYSQPLCTALQIALAELLRSLGIVPNAVVGHSSGEIAAAYLVGGLSLRSACKVALYRGQVSEKLKEALSRPGAMMSVNLTEDQVVEYLGGADLLASRRPIHVACINSPSNLTLSGDEEAIDKLGDRLTKLGIFAQKLNTGVPYHSPTMHSIASEYQDLMGDLEPRALEGTTAIRMISSVTGDIITSSSLTSPTYWVKNLISPVRFSDAIQTLARPILGRSAGIGDIIEVGPHCALRRPIKDTLGTIDAVAGNIEYSAVLIRQKAPLQTLLESLGSLFCRGHAVSISAANQHDRVVADLIPFLVDCPEYPFDRSNTYWAESRLSKDLRRREPTRNDVLGPRFYDNPYLLRWRTFLSIASMPWIKDHMVSDTIIFPGMGMITMALEAVRQASRKQHQHEIFGYNIKEAHFLSPILVSETIHHKTETILHLRPRRKPYEKQSTWFEVEIYALSDDKWDECFKALIGVEFVKPNHEAVALRQGQLTKSHLTEQYAAAEATCTKSIDTQKFYKYSADHGLQYGNWFQLLKDILWDGGRIATARVDISSPYHTTDLVHPVLLDAALQLLQAQRSQGLSKPVTTSVPHSISDGWISATGWLQPNTFSVRYLTNVTPSAKSRDTECTITGLSEDGQVLCTFPKVILRSTSKSETTDLSNKRFVWGIDWKPHLSLLDPYQLHHACNTGQLKDESEWSEYNVKLESVLGQVLHTTYSQIVGEGLVIPSHMKQYVAWIEYYVKHKLGDISYPTTDGVSLNDQLQYLEQLYPSWGYMVRVARDLRDILTGRQDPLHIAYSTGLAEALYVDASDKMCDNRFSSMLELLSHEKPDLKILEVGAGTGGLTRRILSLFRDLEKRTGASTFSKYMYTDISPALFERAAETFSDFKDRIAFKTFDLERDPCQQGFESEMYDLIIAGSVLHATTNLGTATQNIRRLLRLGGHFLNVEIVVPEKTAMHFAFGTLPGWFSKNDGLRDSNPIVDEATWDQVLQDYGFTKNILTIRDFTTENCHLLSAMLSTATEQQKPAKNPISSLLIIVNERSKLQAALAQSFLEGLCADNQYQWKVVSINEVQHEHLSDADITICLVEYGGPLLHRVSGDEYDSLKLIIRHCQRLLWVTCAEINDMTYPFHGVMQGWLRSMRSESFEKHIVTLNIEANEHDTVSPIANITKVFEASFLRNSPELEYIVRDGRLLSGRLTQEPELDSSICDLISPQLKKQPLVLDGDCPMRLALGSIGMLDTIHFVEDVDYYLELGPEDIEIEAKAWGLSFRDLFAALGRLNENDLGADYAGIVTRIGSACKTDLRPGDRVCALSLGCMRTICRTHESNVFKIPEGLTFEAVTSLLLPGITAYQCLVNVARLRKGEKVLVHSAAGSTGQVTVSIAKWLGAEIYATVGYDDKKELLVKKFGLDPENIFYSRDTSFAESVMRATNGYGVDVVVNSLSGDALQASFECVAPYGRFIEIGKADINANSPLSMAAFKRNVSFCAVDIYHMGHFRKELISDLMKNVLDLVAKGAISLPSPIETFSVSTIEAAFRHLQTGKSMGRIVITVNHSDTALKRVTKRRRWSLAQDASYLIAGGLGGLGRAICIWLADKGAKNLIIPSRSGPSSKAASELISELQERGVKAVAPKCDVTSYPSLKELLDDCAGTMPPVKGCINAAMVLQDAVFDNMTLEQWQTTIRSKIHSSWNLHRQLPSLDFFIFLSSMAGIIGSVAQSNYAAGCSFQDSLALQRSTLGERALSLDIGWMRAIGIIAETERYQLNRKNAGDIGQVETEELLAVLDLYCGPADPDLPQKGQLLLGVIVPTELVEKGQPLPAILQRPLFSGFASTDKGVQSERSQKGPDLGFLFRQAATAEARTAVVVKSLSANLARAMNGSPEDIDPAKTLSDYGVDSLMAIELREWIGAQFGATVAVFDIMGGIPISNIGALVVARSTVAYNAVNH